MYSSHILITYTSDPNNTTLQKGLVDYVYMLFTYALTHLFLIQLFCTFISDFVPVDINIIYSYVLYINRKSCCTNWDHLNVAIGWPMSF